MRLYYGLCVCYTYFDEHIIEMVFKVQLKAQCTKIYRNVEL